MIRKVKVQNKEGTEALVAVSALDHWRELGWKPVGEVEVPIDEVVDTPYHEEHEANAQKAQDSTQSAKTRVTPSKKTDKASKER